MGVASTLARVIGDVAEQLRRQIVELEEERAQRQEEIATLNLRLRDPRQAVRRIGGEIKSLRNHLRLLEETGDPEAASELAKIQASTIAAAAQIIMTKHGGRMALAQLVIELQAVGKLRDSSGAQATLLKALSRDGRFERDPAMKHHWRLIPHQ